MKIEIKISNLTEENIGELLEKGSYAVFDINNQLVDIVEFELNTDENVNWRTHFTDNYNEYGGWNLNYMLRNFRDCSLVNVNLINKPVETTNEQPVKSDLIGFKAKLLNDAYYALKYAEEDLLEKNRLKNIDPDEQCTIPSDSFEVQVDSVSHELILNGKTCLDYDKL